LMGPITPALFEQMQIPWELFPNTPQAIEPVLARAVAHMNTQRTPFALIMQQDAVAPHPLTTAPVPVARGTFCESLEWPKERPSRGEVLRAVRAVVAPGSVLIATTGFTGRELYALGDRVDQLYMVGSMGCAAALGLGLAIGRPDTPVIVLDGDGALLMRLGILATLGIERPPNLIHIVLDNEVHDSTGGQSSAAHSVDFAAVAAACGVPTALRADTAEALARAVQAARGLTLIHIKTKPGSPKELPRPKITPEAVALRVRTWLGEARDHLAASDGVERS
jgi:phosphonopyruvate decarboxylase